MKREKILEICPKIINTSMGKDRAETYPEKCFQIHSMHLGWPSLENQLFCPTIS
jgi:hypothetical protein